MSAKPSAPMLPTEILEQRAIEQRRRLHNSVVELRSTLKERLNVRRTAREYMLPAAGVVAVVGLMMGYSLTGIFTSR